MSIWDDVKGTLQSSFGLGRTGPKAKNSSGVFELRNNADDGYAVARSARVQSSGTTVNDIPTLLDLRGRVADIEFSSAGDSVPAAGTNTGKFGFVHTAGGTYSAGDVIYDDGSNILKIPAEVCRHITTRAAISGTVSMDANGIYVNQGGTWTLKGDGGATDTGKSKWIKVAYSYDDTFPLDSTATIPNGATVVRTVNVVATAFNGTSPTITVTVNGSTPATLINSAGEIAEAAQYERRDFQDIGADNAGSVRVSVTIDGSSAGAGAAWVEYATPNS